MTTKFDEGQVLQTIVVIGGGTMGSGIAQDVLLNLPGEPRVTVMEADASRTDNVRSALESSIRGDADPRGALEAIGRLEVITFPDGLTSVDPQLVIEAVPEREDLKAQVLGAVSRRWPSALIASNTSSLSLTRLSRAVNTPGQFIGMHFFNPVPRSKLVELVVPKLTDASTIARSRHFIESLGKEVIQVGDSPGFATSRLGVMIGLEAIRMVEAGVASASDIDRGMVLGYKYPIGPLKLTDLIGLDVRLAIADYLCQELGPRFAPPQLMRDMVAAGHLGKKTGQGFYSW